MTIPDLKAGGCRCGAVRYEVRGKPVGGIACHCRDCQYVSGGAANLSWIFDRPGFQITKGAPAVFKAKPTSGGTYFCAQCGVHLFSQPDTNRDFVAIKVGSLDDASGFKVDADMWTISAPDWHSLHDGAAHYECNIPSAG
ncbi:MAG: GFA family protein [Novosphingobium sp.]